MKTYFLIFVLGLTTVLTSCTKQELLEPDSAVIPDLKAAACTPSIWNYYIEDNSIQSPFLPQTCFPDLVMVTSSNYISSGRLVTAASCRFNDKGTIQWHITGMGMFYGHLYEANITNEYHIIGSITGQGAQVTHILDEAVFTDLTTSETYTTTMIIKQTINGNGEVVIDELTFVPCE